MPTNDIADGLGGRLLHTITFQYSRDLLKAVASSLGRVGDCASTMEVETFIREAVAANVQDLVQTHLHRPSVMKAKVRKSSTVKTGMKARLRRT